MRVLLISSSPHKKRSQTFLLAQELVKGLGPSVKTEVIQLCDYRIEFCRACERCHKKILQCPIKDDACSILDKMLEAEGIILASPNYINQVTASMKALFDRSSHFIHCKRLLGKYVSAVVSSGSGQDKEVLDYLRHYSNVCGAQYIGGVFSSAQIGKEKKEEALNLGKSLRTALKDKKVFPEEMKVIKAGIEHFRRVMEKRKDDWIGEYRYWKEKGWI